MIAGFLLFLHLHVVDSLTTYTTLDDIQGDLPQLPPLQGLGRINDRNGADAINNLNIKEEGIPEGEMVIPVKNDPLLDAALQVNVDVSPTPRRPNASWCRYQDLRRALGETADYRRIVIQVIPDVDHVVLAKNNLHTLMRRTGKKNLLFICRDVLQCEATLQHNVSCFIDDSFPGSSAPIFAVLLTALQLKYSITYMDFDTSMVKALPLGITLDMLIPYGVTPRAHSLYMAGNTPNTIRFHKMATHDAHLHVNKTFAAVFKSVLDKSLKLIPPLTIDGVSSCVKLPVDPTCPILRHPFFKAPADRMLWLKEKQMWFSDTAGYYTSPTMLYLSYENNYDMGRRTVEYEIHALKNALAFGEILNRSVILPKFLCPKCQENVCKPTNCLLGGILNMTSFDSVFGAAYREHSFRGHPLVPMATKKNISENIQIASPLRRGMQAAGGVELLPRVTPNRVIIADNFYEGPDSDEVLELFIGYANTKILRFVNLYGAFSGFNSARHSLEFERKLKQGIVPLMKL